jgi:hypothetical protein
MAGKKGRSGRRPLLEENTVKEILEVSSNILLRWLGNDLVDDERKIPVVAQLCAKRIPAKMEMDLGEGTQILVIRSNRETKQINNQTKALPR